MINKKQTVSKQDQKTYGPYGPGELRYEGSAAGMVAVEIPVEMLKDKSISGDALKLYAILKAISEGKIKVEEAEGKVKIKIGRKKL